MRYFENVEVGTLEEFGEYHVTKAYLVRRVPITLLVL